MKYGFFRYDCGSKQEMLLFRVEDLVHQLPFFSRGGMWIATLELTDVGFPFGLAGKGGKALHVALPIEIVNSVNNHEKLVVERIDLHGKYANFMLTGDDFGPYMGMDFKIPADEFRIVF